MNKGNPLPTAGWLESHGDYLYGYALSKLKDSSLAEDMVQETLIAAFSAMDRYKATASLRTWLTAILKNKIMDHWRRQGREIVVSDLIGDLEGEVGVDDFFDQAGRWVDMPRRYPDPDEAMESMQFWQVFELCLSKLSPRQAEVFIAREVHGMESKEIGSNYALSPSNVFVLMHRARVALGKCLEIHWMNKDEHDVDLQTGK